MPNLIHFYWDGPISETRFKILKDSVYSTRVFNPNHKIQLVTNTLNQSDFEERFDIEVVRWDESFFDGLLISPQKVLKYKNANPRDFSDLFRLILLYQFGGTYIDTDDLCIFPLSTTPNIVCRSYDPHTSFYNKIEPEGCVPGWTREIAGYDHIPMFPRNDCWQNWIPKHNFIWKMLNHPQFQANEDIVWIGGDWSWQSIANDICLQKLDECGIDWNFRLTLLYLFEDFVSASSFWDRCHHGGEMCDIWNELPNLKDYEWGFYKCDIKTANQFYQKIIDTYPNISHLWLHSKDMKAEWFEEIDETRLYSVSTWLYYFIKEEIKCFPS